MRRLFVSVTASVLALVGLAACTTSVSAHDPYPARYPVVVEHRDFHRHGHYHRDFHRYHPPVAQPVLVPVTTPAYATYYPPAPPCGVVVQVPGISIRLGVR